jgi:hypothetical protein
VNVCAGEALAVAAQKTTMMHANFNNLNCLNSRGSGVGMTFSWEFFDKVVQWHGGSVGDAYLSCGWIRRHRWERAAPLSCRSEQH